MSKNRLPLILKKELDNSGADYRLELGSKHWKLFVNNAFCGILPLNNKKDQMPGCGLLNIRSQIRREVRKMQGTAQ